MENIASILMILFGTFLVFGVPIIVSYLLYRFIKRRNLDKRWRLIALVPLLFLAYAVYQGVFYPNKLYEEHFTEVTGLELPENSEFLLTENWTSGAYSRNYITLSLLKIGKNNYQNLPDQLETKGLSENNEIEADEILFSKIQRIKKENNFEIDRGFNLTKNGKIIYYVGMLSDQESIIVYAWHK